MGLEQTFMQRGTNLAPTKLGGWSYLVESSPVCVHIVWSSLILHYVSRQTGLRSSPFLVNSATATQQQQTACERASQPAPVTIKGKGGEESKSLTESHSLCSHGFRLFCRRLNKKVNIYKKSYKVLSRVNLALCPRVYLGVAGQVQVGR